MKKNKKFLNIFTITTIVVMVMIGFAAAIYAAVKITKMEWFGSYWKVAEPLIAHIELLMVVFAAFSLFSYLLRKEIAKRKVVRSADDTDGVATLAFIFDNDAPAHFRKTTGIEVDYAIDVKKITGSKHLKTKKQLKKLLKYTNKIIRENQEKKINVVCSGTTSFNLLLGMAVGKYHKITVWQFQRDCTYKKMPTMMELDL